MTTDEFRQNFFEAYAEHGDTCDDEWFETFFQRAFTEGDPVEMEIEWENAPDQKVPASGDDNEKLLSFNDGDGTSYWTLSSATGSQGPFETRREAIEEMGYDPDDFPPDSGLDEDEDVSEAEEEEKEPDFGDDDEDIDDDEAYDDEEEEEE